MSRALLLVLVLVAQSAPGQVAAEPALWRTGFYWSPTVDRYPPEVVPWHLYTHVVQMAVQPDRDCGIDERRYRPDRARDRLVAAGRAAGVRVSITLMQDEPIRFIATCTAPSRIDGFVAKLAAYVTAHGYDGLDIDWEGEVVPDQYQALVRKLRSALPGKVLTADIAVHQRSYLVPVQDDLDRIHLMSYDLWTSDYHGRALGTTWHNSALLAADDGESHQSAEAGLAYLLDSGLRPARISLGLPFYGYVFQGCEAGAWDGPACRRLLVQPGQPFAPEGYRKTQIEFREVDPTFGGAGIRRDAARGVPYLEFRSAWARPCRLELCRSDAFVTFSDEQQFSDAGTMVRTLGLGGVMTFALHQEHRPEAEGDARYPLSAAMVRGLRPPDNNQAPD
jgi:GH18 family chitinase